jgi:hypothetical protein
VRVTGNFLIEAAIVIVTLGIWALFAWGVSFLVTYVTGYEIGFLRTAGGLILLSVVGSALFGNLKGSTD